MSPNWDIITYTTSNIHGRSEDPLGTCGTQANFVHKQVFIRMTSNWNLFRKCLNKLSPP